MKRVELSAFPFIALCLTFNFNPKAPHPDSLIETHKYNNESSRTSPLGGRTESPIFRLHSAGSMQESENYLKEEGNILIGRHIWPFSHPGEQQVNEESERRGTTESLVKSGDGTYDPKPPPPPPPRQ